MWAENAVSVQNALLLVQTVVLAVTGYLVWRYTKATERYTEETAALRKETVRQGRMSLRPIVLPEFPDDHGRLLFRLRNCGIGCALNVRVPPVRTDRYAQGDVNFGQIESRFDAVGYLTGAGETWVESETFADGQKLANSPFKQWFHPSRPGPETTIEITFGDVEGHQYKVAAKIAQQFDLDQLPREVLIGSIQDIVGT